ncbi:MAG: DEAD/DEAH box helicase [Candidatus Woesearchaeota archaeon]|jgi:Fanconi anemia group M protein
MKENVEQNAEKDTIEESTIDIEYNGDDIEESDGVMNNTAKKTTMSPRMYQQTIFATATRHNTLVVLPTGLGKTLIAKMLAKYRLSQYPDSKILFLTPTKPLATQHMDTFIDTFEVGEMFLALGTTEPDKRKQLYLSSKIIFATPQTIENDIINKRISISNVSLIIFDEAHRATGDYSYGFIAKQYEKNGKNKRILALTASPGTDKETIQTICNNLFIEKIEAKKQTDEDVSPYVENTNLKYVEVKLPDVFKKIKSDLKKALDLRINSLKNLGCFNQKPGSHISKKDYLGLNAHCMKDIATGNASSETYQIVSLCAQGMKINHAIELLETQGIISVHKYFEKMWQESTKTKNKALISFVTDPNIKTARFYTIEAVEKNIEHPKLEKLKEIITNEVSANKNVKIIVFNQYRDSIKEIVEELNKIENVNCKSFVGQAKKNGTGMTQKEQKERISDFAMGGFNVIVMSSVGEEGLDIPSVDLVIFYEPIPSAIRTIQRRGRTGRHSIGRIITLVAKDTIDVAYRWSAHRKEKNMFKALDSITNDVQKNLDDKSIVKKTEETKEVKANIHKTLDNFSKKKTDEEDEEETILKKPNNPTIKILCDARENGNLIKELVNLNVDCEVKNLECDFYLSSRCGVEKKKIKDFVDSIIDGRLLLQIKNLKENFNRPLVLLEGEEDIYTIRSVHPNAIRAMLATITVSYGIPILYSKTEKESAALLYTIAKREQDSGFKEFNMHFEKKQLTHDDELIYVVSAIPGIGTSTAKSLLSHFGSISGIFFASEDDLKSIDGIGEGTAKKIKEIFTRQYKK